MAKKKILLYAHYYVPDTASTGQILKDQAEGRLEQLADCVVGAGAHASGKYERNSVIDCKPAKVIRKLYL